MKNNHLKILSIISLGLLAGCSSGYLFDEDPSETNVVVQPTNQQMTSVRSYENYTENVAASAIFSDEFNSILAAKEYKHALLSGSNGLVQNDVTQSESTNNINFYVRGLMQDMIANLQYVNQTTPIAVTSFVLLNSDFHKTNLLGNQIAESLIHEIHKFGIPIIDYKTTDYIRVTEQGDFTFSRDYQELKGGLPIRYVVSGTLVKHRGGYLVNARVIGVESKAVVATAQSFIPEHVASAIIDDSDEISQSAAAQSGVSLVGG